MNEISIYYHLPWAMSMRTHKQCYFLWNSLSLFLFSSITRLNNFQMKIACNHLSAVCCRCSGFCFHCENEKYFSFWNWKFYQLRCVLNSNWDTIEAITIFLHSKSLHDMAKKKPIDIFYSIYRTPDSTTTTTTDTEAYSIHRLCSLLCEWHLTRSVWKRIEK